MRRVRLAAIVEETSSAGLKIRFADRSIGFVKRRETTWALMPLHPALISKVGDTVEVTPLLGEEYQRSKLYSMRLLSPDPWAEATGKYPPGTTVTARVTSVFGNGVFLEVATGVQGHVPISELAPFAFEKPEDLFRPGDHVRAIVKSLDPMNQRTLLCSIRARHEGSVRDSASETDIERTAEADHAGSWGPDRSYFVGRIRLLLIDDNESFCVAAQGACEAYGHSLDYETDPELGISRAAGGNYDLILVDLIMPGVTGADVYRHLRALDLSTPIALVTGEEGFDPRLLDDIDDQPPVVRKPLEIADIEALALEVELPSDRLVDTVSGSDGVHFAESPPSSYGDIAELVTEHSAQLAKRLVVSSWAVFEWLPESRSVHLMRAAGFRAGFRREELDRRLTFSPIRNVAEMGESVQTDALSSEGAARQRYFRSLSGFLDFESLLCLPVFAGEHPRYAILLADPRPDYFPEGRATIAEAEARVLSARLAAWHAERQLQKVQALALGGRLASSLAHELRNTLGALRLSLQNTQKSVERLAARGLVPPDSNIIAPLANALAGSAQMADILGSFTQRSHDSLEMEDLKEVIIPVVTRLGIIAARERVSLEHAVPDGLRLLTCGPRVGQVVENLVLNAIQHVNRYRTSQARVDVKAARFRRDDQEFVDIRVRDNGPGIHAADYERVFEMGYTTRSDGPGLGLALCRDIAASLGGSVKIAESIILEGTVMSFVLPIRQEENVDE